MVNAYVIPFILHPIQRGLAIWLGTVLEVNASVVSSRPINVVPEVVLCDQFVLSVQIIKGFEISLRLYDLAIFELYGKK